jgi:hypothetical protein
MFRKLTFALIATAALGAAALAPTSASAHGSGGGGGSHGGYGGFHGSYGGFHGGYRGYSGYRSFHRDWRYRGWGYGPGWCYYHPDQCDAE